MNEETKDQQAPICPNPDLHRWSLKEKFQTASIVAVFILLGFSLGYTWHEDADRDNSFIPKQSGISCCYDTNYDDQLQALAEKVLNPKNDPNCEAIYLEPDVYATNEKGTTTPPVQFYEHGYWYVKCTKTYTP